MREISDRTVGDIEALARVMLADDVAHATKIPAELTWGDLNLSKQAGYLRRARVAFEWIETWKENK